MSILKNKNLIKNKYLIHGRYISISYHDINISGIKKGRQIIYLTTYIIFGSIQDMISDDTYLILYSTEYKIR